MPRRSHAKKPQPPDRPDARRASRGHGRWSFAGSGLLLLLLVAPTASADGFIGSLTGTVTGTVDTVVETTLGDTSLNMTLLGNEIGTADLVQSESQTASADRTSTASTSSSGARTGGATAFPVSDTMLPNLVGATWWPTLLVVASLVVLGAAIYATRQGAERGDKNRTVSAKTANSNAHAHRGPPVVVATVATPSVPPSGRQATKPGTTGPPMSSHTYRTMNIDEEETERARRAARARRIH
ncbi:MAG: hypothetical protein KY455_02275 [Euryarchaeota archaeon]|nr:hypothetical protein [Euryarchaeota archaeon]